MQARKAKRSGNADTDDGNETQVDNDDGDDDGATTMTTTTTTTTKQKKKRPSSDAAAARAATAKAIESVSFMLEEMDDVPVVHNAGEPGDVAPRQPLMSFVDLAVSPIRACVQQQCS